jgi:hypothetical protein
MPISYTPLPKYKGYSIFKPSDSNTRWIIEFPNTKQVCPYLQSEQDAQRWIDAEIAQQLTAGV